MFLSLFTQKNFINIFLKLQSCKELRKLHVDLLFLSKKPPIQFAQWALHPSGVLIFNNLQGTLYWSPRGGNSLRSKKSTLIPQMSTGGGREIRGTGELKDLSDSRVKGFQGIERRAEFVKEISISALMHPRPSHSPVHPSWGISLASQAAPKWSAVKTKASGITMSPIMNAIAIAFFPSSSKTAT